MLTDNVIYTTGTTINTSAISIGNVRVFNILEETNILLNRFLDIYDHLSKEERDYVKSIINTKDSDNHTMLNVFFNKKTEEILKT